MVSALHMEPWVQCSMSMSMWCFPEYPRPLHQLIWELQPLPLEAQLQALALEAEAPARMDTIPEPPSAPLAWPAFGFCARSAAAAASCQASPPEYRQQSLSMSMDNAHGLLFKFL